MFVFKGAAHCGEYLVLHAVLFADSIRLALLISFCASVELAFSLYVSIAHCSVLPLPVFAQLRALLSARCSK